MRRIAVLFFVLLSLSQYVVAAGMFEFGFVRHGGISHLFRDEFETDLSAGSVNGSNAEPGPGVTRSILSGRIEVINGWAGIDGDGTVLLYSPSIIPSAYTVFTVIQAITESLAIYVAYEDADNYALVTVTSTSISLSYIQDGTPTVIDTQLSTVSSGSQIVGQIDQDTRTITVSNSGSVIISDSSLPEFTIAGMGFGGNGSCTIWSDEFVDDTNTWEDACSVQVDSFQVRR